MKLADQDLAVRPIVVGSWPGPSFRWNPFIAHFCESLAEKGCLLVDVDDPRRLPRRIDILHVHWPEQIFWKGGGPTRLVYRTLSTLRALSQLKRQGVRIVWMVHNLDPHELGGIRKRLWPLIKRRLARLADGFVTLSPSTLPLVRAAIPELANKPGVAGWHPAYPPHSPLPPPAMCRNEMGLAEQAELYAFLGMVRPYKGVEELIAAFIADPDPRRRLLIAGHCDAPAFAERIHASAAADPRIDIRLDKLDDRQFAMLTAAADIVVLPFRDYLHSGSMIHALSHARPVLTPSAPFADALAREVGREWVTTYSGPLTAEALATAERPNGAPELANLTFGALASATHDLYLRLDRS